MNDGGYLAVDVGGTKLEVGVVSDDRRLLYRSRCATPPHDVWNSLESLIVENLEWARTHRVETISCGVGCGGPMDLARRTVSPLHIPQWRDFPLERRIAELASLPVIVDNDAKALVRAEWWSRTTAGTSAVPASLMSIVMGTGVGAGIILNGTLLHGRTGNAGHIGHVIVEPDGNVCECGARGCLEAHVSGRALQQLIGGRPDAASVALRDRIGRWLGVAIATTAATVDLVDVTLGGSVALGLGDELCRLAQTAAREHAGLSMIRNLTVSLVADRELAPLFGAAGLAKYPSPYEPDLPR